MSGCNGCQGCQNNCPSTDPFKDYLIETLRNLEAELNDGRTSNSYLAIAVAISTVKDIVNAYNKLK